MFPHAVLFPCFLFWPQTEPDACGGSGCCARSPLRPFPQFTSAGFTGFTLTPLTPALRPPTATHPLSTNQLSITSWSRAVFASIGRFLLHLCFWLVTCYHPPDCSEFCFCFFPLPPFLIHSAEVGPCSKKWLDLWARGLLNAWVALFVPPRCWLHGVSLRMPTFASDQVSWCLVYCVFATFICFAQCPSSSNKLKHLTVTKLHAL